MSNRWLKPVANASVDIVTSFACLILVAGDACGADPASVTETSAVRAINHEDLLYFGERPFLIRLHLSVDGKPWDATRDAMVARQFARLDRDEDGLIQEAQLQGVPLSGAVVNQLTAWDTDPADGHFSLAEFQALFRHAGQSPFLLAEGAGPAASRIRLFPHLDLNKDGRITTHEFQSARTHLQKLDYDDDQTISTTELAPFRNPLVRQRRLTQEKPLAAEAPFLALRTLDSPSELARAVIRRYGKHSLENLDTESDACCDSACRVDDLGSARDEVSAFDSDQNGELTVSELTEYLSSCDPHLELQIDLPLRRSTRPRMKVIRDAFDLSQRRSKRRASSRLRLRIGSTDFELRGLGSRNQSVDNRRFYLVQFRTADQDKNDYLDPSEFSNVGLDAKFEIVDANADGQVVQDEVEDFLDQDAFSSQTQVVASVAADTRTLFHVLDVNSDQRLAPRELNTIETRLQMLDANHDTAIDSSEISHRYRLSFSLGKPRVFKEARMMQNEPGAPAPQATQIADAPPWFAKMDRNQDGDLSWREFLGPRDVFKRMDKDQDGLITFDEIRVAGANIAP